MGKLPDIPWSQASGVKTHKWLYSQVYKGIGAKRPNPAWEWTSGDHGFPGCVELFRTPQALGLIAGDSLAPAGNFEGCIYSAHCAAEVIKKLLLTGTARASSNLSTDACRRRILFHPQFSIRGMSNFHWYIFQLRCPPACLRM